MANINRLTEKILEESRSKSQEIITEAKQEGARILENKINEAKALGDSLISKAKIEGTSTKDRIISNAKLKVRNEKLEVKQQIIEKVFNIALERLIDMPAKEYKEFIKSSILPLKLTGEQNLILNNKGIDYVSADFIDEINAELEKNESGFKIVLSDKVGSFKGGFILEKNGIEINCSFETLTNSLKDELEYEITTLLFA